MQEKIGKTAGRIWEVLRDRREISISQLPGAVNEKSALVHQAIGWLAREGKVGFRTQGSRTFISLLE